MYKFKGEIIPRYDEEEHSQILFEVNVFWIVCDREESEIMIINATSEGIMRIGFLVYALIEAFSIVTRS